MQSISFPLVTSCVFVNVLKAAEQLFPNNPTGSQTKFYFLKFHLWHSYSNTDRKEKMERMY